MATSAFGAGVASAGVSRAGFGTPATSNAPGAAAIGTGRKIDALTKDYVIDSTGNATRTTTVEQLVYLAIETIKNSSAVKDLGLDPAPDRVTAHALEDLTRAAEQAFMHLTVHNMVQLVSVTVDRDERVPSRILRSIRYRDLTTDEEQELQL